MVGADRAAAAAEPTCTGVIVTVPSAADARAVRSRVVARDDLAPDNVRIVDVGSARHGSELAGPWERVRARCERYGVERGDLADLEALVTEATPGTAAAMQRAVDLCIADTGFVLVVIAQGGTDPLGSAVVQTLQVVFERPIARLASNRDVAFRIVRPNPDRLERRIDRDLLAAVLDRGKTALDAWRRWISTHSINDYPGFSQVAPALFERLRDLGVDDPALGRIRGMRRRAWYTARLMGRDAAEAVVALREHGCHPYVLGDIAAAIPAGATGAVRPVRSLDLYVPPDDVATASAALAALGWVPNHGDTRTSPLVEHQVSHGFRNGPGRLLRLCWQPLPARCARLVTSGADESESLPLDGVDALTQSPTAQLLRLWASSGDPDPGHPLRTLCATADLVARRGHEIDWRRLRSQCEQLGLAEYAEMYVRALPARLGELCGS